MTNTTENFNEIVKQIIASCPSQKAVDFTNKISAQVLAKGEDWINRNALALRVDYVPTQAGCPVSDNRLFYIGEFQSALVTCK